MEQIVTLNWLTVTIIGGLVAVAAYSLKRNLAAIDQKLERIESNMIGREVCGLRHESLEKEIQRHNKNIAILFRRANGMPETEIEFDRDEEGG